MCQHCFHSESRCRQKILEGKNTAKQEKNKISIWAVFVTTNTYSKVNDIISKTREDRLFLLCQNFDEQLKYNKHICTLFKTCLNVTFCDLWNVKTLPFCRNLYYNLLQMLIKLNNYCYYQRIITGIPLWLTECSQVQGFLFVYSSYFFIKKTWENDELSIEWKYSPFGGGGIF